MKKKLVVTLLWLLPVFVLGQDSILHVHISPLEIISERSLKADELHAIDSTLLQNCSSLDVSAALQRSGLGVVNSYGAPGSIASFRLGGMSSNYVTVELNGAVLNSPTLGMADLSLIPSFFIQSASIGERNFSAFQRNVGIAATLRLDAKVATRNEVQIESSTSSLGNVFSGISVSRKMNRLSWSVRSCYARNENNFTYRDVYQWGAPVVHQVNNNNKTSGVQGNLVYQGSRQTHYFNVMSVNRYALLPTIMGGVTNVNANQFDDLFQSSYYSEGKRKPLFANVYLQSKQGASFTYANQAYRNEVSATNIQSNLLNVFFNGAIQGRTGLLQMNPTASLTSLNYLDWKSNVQWKGASLWASYIQSFFNGKVKSVSWVKPEWRSDRKPIISGEVGLEFPYKWRRTKSQLSFSKSVKSRMPSANDLYWIQGGNPDLLSERANWLQCKWDNEYSFQEGRTFQFQLNAKSGNVSNWIQWMPLPDNIWVASNFKSVAMKQIEAVVSWKTKVKKGDLNFTGRTEVTSTTAKNIGSPGVFDMVYTPRLRASSSVQYFRNHWSVLISDCFVSSRFTDEGNTTYNALPRFNVLNASFNKDFFINRNKLTLQFEIQNITNVQYQWIRGYAVPGRVYSFGFKFFIQ